jgi:hypothetical protein
MTNEFRWASVARSSRENTEDKEEKRKLRKAYRPSDVFVRFVFPAGASLFFRTGSSGEAIPFVPDGPGILPL